MNPEPLKDSELERTLVQRKLDAEKTAFERNRLGQFATPPTLARAIASVALAQLPMSKKVLNFFEPSVGSGAFFSALLGELGDRGLGEAVGVELDEGFAAAARRLWSSRGLAVINDDFANVAPFRGGSGFADILLANPPYVRHHHLSANAKSLLNGRASELLGSPVSGLTGLYVYFLLLCHDWLKEDGVAAWLIPTEWMSVNYGKSLRRYLSDKVRLLRVHVFDAEDVKFDDALVSSSVVFYQKGVPTDECVFTSGPDILLPARTKRIKMDALRGTEKWQRYFGGAEKHSTGDGGPVLGDFFEIRRGIATGSNDFFIKTVDEFKRLGIQEIFLKPILPASRHLSKSVIDEDADGFADTAPKLALLDCSLSEAVIKTAQPALWEYLSSKEAAEVRKGYLSTRRSPWFRQERRKRPDIVLTYMGRVSERSANPFRFFLNRSKAICANSYLLMTLKPGVGRDERWLKELVDSLNSTGVDEFKKYGRVYGGGLFKLEPKELARMPLSRSLASIKGVPVDQGQVAMVL